MNSTITINIDGDTAHIRVEQPVLGPATPPTTTPYDDDNFEFLMAMQAWKKKTGRKWPSWSEALAVAKSLGYARMA